MRKISVSAAVILLSLGLAGCSNPISEKMQNVSEKQTTIGIPFTNKNLTIGLFSLPHITDKAPKTESASSSAVSSSSSSVSESSSSHSVKKAAAESSSSSTSATKKSVNDESLWNNEKDAQLESFFDEWAPKMNQSYTRYDGQTPITTKVGLTFPEDLGRVRVNDHSVSVGWSPSGTGDYDYNVVAIYNYDRPDDQEDGPMRVTYFFAFHNGQPVALVDQTTNGYSLNAKPTSNHDVAAAFEQIAK